MTIHTEVSRKNSSNTPNAKTDGAAIDVVLQIKNILSLNLPSNPREALEALTNYLSMLHPDLQIEGDHFEYKWVEKGPQEYEFRCCTIRSLLIAGGTPEDPILVKLVMDEPT